MFKIVSDPIFTAPVTVHAPTPAGTERQDFKATFVLVDDQELRAVEDEARARAPQDAFAGQKASIRRILRGWSEVAGEGGSDLPFSEGALGAALALPWFRLAVIRAYNAAIYADPATGN